MAQPQLISLPDLLVDVENPRLAESSGGQRGTLRALGQEQGPKFSVLAKDIGEYGLNPGDPFYVMALDDNAPIRLLS